MIPNYIYRLTTLFYKISPLAQILLITLIVVTWTAVNIKLSDINENRLNVASFIVSVLMIIVLGLINRVIMDRSYYLIPFQLLFPLERYRIQQIILNAMFFLPFGLTLPYVLNNRLAKPGRMTILLGFLLSLIVEVLQLVLHRGTFETTDIIMNTLGTAIGTLSYLAYTRLKKGADKNDDE